MVKVGIRRYAGLVIALCVGMLILLSGYGKCLEAFEILINLINVNDAASPQTQYESQLQALLNSPEYQIYRDKKPWLGVEWQTVDAGIKKVNHIVQNSPADLAGLKPGDCITSIHKGDLVFDLQDIKRFCRPGDRVLVVFKRDVSPSMFKHEWRIMYRYIVLGADN